MTAHDGAARPRVRLSTAAAQALLRAHADSGAPTDALRIEVPADFAYDLSLGPREDGDVEALVALDDGAPFSLAVCLAPDDARRADGLTIEFVSGPHGAGFDLRSPLQPPRVRERPAPEAAALLREGRFAHFVDVRTEYERDIARIEGSRLLDDEYRAELLELPRNTPLLFVCHHGIRSRRAAMQFIAEGFTDVSNLSGGIAAWSAEVDPKVPTY